MKARMTLALFGAVLALGGCGGEAQDADEPEGTFQVEVADASFPAEQTISQQSRMRIKVRNAGDEALPDVAVTLETKGKDDADGPVAFAQSESDSRLADPNRPVWILDDGPKGGTSAYANTWTLGRLGAGETASFEWKVTAVEAGDYSISYKVAPGLDGKATLAEGSDPSGSFKVSISDEPVPARVNSKGEVVRGEEPGAGKD